MSGQQVLDLVNSGALDLDPYDMRLALCRTRKRCGWPVAGSIREEGEGGGQGGGGGEDAKDAEDEKKGDEEEQ